MRNPCGCADGYRFAQRHPTKSRARPYGRSGSHPRIAPICPAIADKVRSYGETPCLMANCRSGPCPRNRAQGALLQGNGIGARAFPSPQPSPGGRGGQSAPREGLVSAGNPCASRLTPKHQRTPNGPLSLRERVRVRGPQACSLDSVPPMRFVRYGISPAPVSGPCPRNRAQGPLLQGNGIGARAFPSPQPSPGGRGSQSVPREGLVSAGNPCASRLTPKHQRTLNGLLSLRERVRVRGPQACSLDSVPLCAS